MSYCVVSENHNTKPRKEVTSSPLNIWDFTNKKKLANKLSSIYHRQCRRYRNHSQSCYKSPCVWYSNLFCHERLSSAKRRVKGSETITIFFWGLYIGSFRCGRNFSARNGLLLPQGRQCSFKFVTPL